MMETYKIVIPGRAVPKQRPRLGKNGAVYTPGKTKAFEYEVGLRAKQVIKKPLTGEVAAIIDVYFNNKKFGDLDNYQKSIFDGLNGVAWVDDRQISYIRIRRHRHKNERVEIEIWETEGE